MCSFSLSKEKIKQKPWPGYKGVHCMCEGVSGYIGTSESALCIL